MREKTKETAPRSNSLFYISAANVFASVAVVVMHCNGCFWYFPSGRLWVTSNFIETIAYWAVPVFFMCSGVTLMDYRDKYSTREFFAKRFWKTVVPFVAWSLVAAGYTVHNGGTLGGVREVIGGIVQSNYLAIYWFFIPLFAAYLSIPALSLFPKERRQKAFGYLTAYAVVSYGIVPLVCALLGISMNGQIQSPVSGGYVMYLLLGYSIEYTPLTKKQRGVIYLLAVAGWLTQFVGTAVFSAAHGFLDGTFKGYLNLPCILQSVGVFVFFKYIPYEKMKGSALLKKGIGFFAPLTFGIYLIHFYFVLEVPARLGFSDTSIFWRTAGAAAVFLLSGLIVWLLKRIPLIRKILP